MVAVAENLSKKAEDIAIPASGGLNLKELGSRLANQAKEDHIQAFAGNLAYRGLFSLFAVLTLVCRFSDCSRHRTSSTSCCRACLRWFPNRLSTRSRIRSSRPQRDLPRAEA